MTFILVFLLSLNVFAAELNQCDPESEIISTHDAGLNMAFCAEWNPDFSFYNSQCCGRTVLRERGRLLKCTPSRSKKSFCDEMTEEQMGYITKMTQEGAPDVLKQIEQERAFRFQQAHCAPHNGFLAWGRPILPNDKNRVVLRRPERCVHFGTDEMVGMVEWVGRRVAERYPDPYSNVRLLVGDISAPRGGCLGGRGGRRGHLSHTTGQDVDLGFLVAKSTQRIPASFTREFDAEANWWLLKQIFQNPYSCVKAVFLDRKLKQRLAKAAKDDPDWSKYQKFVQHVRYHRNHFHVRIAEEPRGADCQHQQAPLEEELPDLAEASDLSTSG